jgi:multicomponent Na+:H+ antiporter subunit D
MKVAMVIFSIMCVGLGVMPGPLYDLLPYEVDYVPYTGAHVVFQLQLLLFSGLAFFLLLDLLKRTLTITLDFDWLYRSFGRTLGVRFNDVTDAAWVRLTNAVQVVVQRVVANIHRHHGPTGYLGRSWPTGKMAFWTTLMLGAYLLAAFW